MAAVTTDSKAVSSVKSESRIGAETNHDSASGAKCFAGNAFSDVRRNHPRYVGQTIVLSVCAVFFPVTSSRFALVRNPFARHLHHF